MRVPKVLGSDQEFGNAILGAEPGLDTSLAAAGALLREFHGYPKTQSRWVFALPDAVCRTGSPEADTCSDQSQDWGRTWLTSGACAYVDLSHLEGASAEEASARGYVAGCHAIYRLVGQAAARASARLGPGLRVAVFADNSDRMGNSYGSHLNVMLSGRTWDAIINRRLVPLANLISHQISSLVITGAGKVGAENGAASADFQLSARADFFECLRARQTTFCRPLVNTRNEALAGDGLARLHCIFYDANLCHYASFLKAGMMQIVTSMIEAGWSSLKIMLDDPLAAVASISRDPTLTVRARMADGRKLTALEIGSIILEQALKFDFSGYVPESDKILSLWGECLEHLRKGCWDILARRLDWVLKRQLLEQARSRGGFSWTDAELRHLDRVYASLDPREGLYLNCERAGLLDRLVSDKEIEDRMANPPRETRAYARGRLLQLAGDRVAFVDWDRVEIWTDSGLRTIKLENPLCCSQAQLDPLIREANSLDDLLDGLTGLTGSTNHEGVSYEAKTAIQ